MESAKLIVGDEEIDVYICGDCGEHEAQINTLNGMICFYCWSLKKELNDGCVEKHPDF